jgi:hypothetical protein
MEASPPRIYPLTDLTIQAHRHLGLIGIAEDADTGQRLGLVVRLCAHEQTRWTGQIDLETSWVTNLNDDEMEAWATRELEALFLVTRPEFRDSDRFGWPRRPRVIFLGGSRGALKPLDWEVRLSSAAAARGFELELVPDPGSQFRVVAERLRAGNPVGVISWRTDGAAEEVEMRLREVRPQIEFMPVTGDFANARVLSGGLLDTFEGLRFAANAPAAIEEMAVPDDPGARLRSAAAALGISRFVVVGGTPKSRADLAVAFPTELELRTVDGVSRVNRRDAAPFAEWAEIIVLWTNTPLDHSVSECFIAAARGKTAVVRVGRRGAGALVADLGDRLSNEIGGP